MISRRAVFARTNNAAQRFAATRGLSFCYGFSGEPETAKPEAWRNLQA